MKERIWVLEMPFSPRGGVESTGLIGSLEMQTGSEVLLQRMFEMMPGAKPDYPIHEKYLFSKTKAI